MIPLTVSEEEGRLILIACGIFRKEIELLVRKNRWTVKTRFLDSSLHVDFNKLSAALTSSLSRCREDTPLVVYGACHPRMETILADANAARTPGQNCVEIVLGRDRFTEEISKGAFFLFEDWAKRWEYTGFAPFNNSPDIMREIFQDAHKYLLAIRTPCSGNYKEEAENVSRLVGLPLFWTDVGLEHLEQTLSRSINEITERAKG